MLRPDGVAWRRFAEIKGELKAVRRGARISRAALVPRLPVSESAMAGWENGIADPTLLHLTQWSDALGFCLVIVGPDGVVLLPEPPGPMTNEAMDSFRMRRLAGPLKSRRGGLSLSQKDLGWHVGVSGAAISNWELVREPPTSIAQIVWAQKLECNVSLIPNQLTLCETDVVPDSHLILPPR